MAFTFPLTRADFLDLLPMQEVKFWLSRQDQHTGLSGGEILAAEVAPPLWRGVVSLAPMSKRASDKVEAMLAALEVPGRKFEAFKAQQVGPAADPLGAVLQGAAPQILAVDPLDPQLLRLSGLPEGFALQSGDLLSFDYDPGNGLRRALHRVVEGAAAASDGNTPNFMITPAIRAGASPGAAVDLIKPFCLAGIVPGSVSYGTTKGNVTSGIGFEFRQTLRR